MIDWAVALAVVACVLVVVTLFWVRAAFVSLNADLRELLDRQAEIRRTPRCARKVRDRLMLDPAALDGEAALLQPLVQHLVGQVVDDLGEPVWPDLPDDRAHQGLPMRAVEVVVRFASHGHGTRGS